MSVTTSATFPRVLGTPTRTDVVLREPDLVDLVTESVAWYSADGAVEVPLARLDNLALRVHLGSRRHAPEHFGIVVTDMREPDVVLGDMVLRAKQSAWTLVRQVVCADAE